MWKRNQIPSKQRYIVGALHADGQGVAEVKVVVVGVGGGEILRPNCNVDVKLDKTNTTSSGDQYSIQETNVLVQIITHLIN